MKITSKKPKGQRIFKCLHLPYNSCGKIIKIRRPYWIEPVGNNWWFDIKLGDWVQEYNGKGGMTTSYYSMRHDGFNDVYSLKAVKKLVAKWNVPKGTKFRASLPFVGHDFFLTK